MTPEITCIIALGLLTTWLVVSILWMGRVLGRHRGEEYWYDRLLLLPMLGLVYLIVPPVMLVQKLRRRK